MIPLSAGVYGHTPQLYQPRGSFDLSRIAISNQTLYVIKCGQPTLDRACSPPTTPVCLSHGLAHKRDRTVGWRKPVCSDGREVSRALWR